MSEKEIGLNEFIANLTPFGEWLDKLTPAERERALDDVRDLKELGEPDAEALVRADFYSAFAEVVRAKAIGGARRSALMAWDLDDGGHDLVSLLLAGKSVWRCGDMMRAVHLMRDAGLPKESIAEIGRLIASFALYCAVYHLDGENIHSQQHPTEFLVMEYRGDRAIGRQATGGKWNEHSSGRPMHGPANPFPSFNDGPPQDGTGGDVPK